MEQRQVEILRFESWARSHEPVARSWFAHTARKRLSNESISDGQLTRSPEGWHGGRDQTPEGFVIAGENSMAGQGQSPAATGDVDDEHRVSEGHPQPTVKKNARPTLDRPPHASTEDRLLHVGFLECWELRGGAAGRRVPGAFSRLDKSAASEPVGARLREDVDDGARRLSCTPRLRRSKPRRTPEQRRGAVHHRGLDELASSNDRPSTSSVLLRPVCPAAAKPEPLERCYSC